MEFCIITPEAGLERYATLSRTHLLLCQIDNLKYWDFYIKRRIAGDLIILDNGAYEGECDWDRLKGRINRVHPHVVALPDFVAQDWKLTRKHSMKFLNENFHTYVDTEWMYMPQAKPGDLTGLLHGMYAALDDERITWMGLPRALCYQISKDPDMRVRLAERIKKHRPDINLHALGMVKGSVDELNALRSTKLLYSIDSNAPVWRGWCGYDITAPWSEIPVNYNVQDLPREIFYARGKSKHELILDNLEACGVHTNVHTGERVSTQRGNIPSSENDRS